MKIVIFCGGYGTRMWPASRKSFPKQFYPLVGGKSFFQITYERFRKAFAAPDIFISTERIYEHFIKKQEKEIPKANIIVEPERKDNMAAIGLVTALLNKKFPNEVMFISWSDHLIHQEDEFLRKVKLAGEYALETGQIVSIDEKPKYPSVHHGWVKVGHAHDNYHGVEILPIVQHFEKPDTLSAKKFFQSASYLINTGYRAWRTDTMLTFYQKYAPEMYAGLLEIINHTGNKNFETFLYREYHRFEKESVENGIFEKLPEGVRVTIPSDVGWEDSGTWQLFYRALRINGVENVLEGGALLEHLDSDGNLVIAPRGKMVGLIGIRNSVVIDTPDGLLVCSMEETDKVKELFKLLEEHYPEFVK